MSPQPADQDGTDLTIGVVNRDREHAVSAQIELAHGALAGRIEIYTVHGSAPEAENSFADPEAVHVQKHVIEPVGKRGLHLPTPLGDDHACQTISRHNAWKGGMNLHS